MELQRHDGNYAQCLAKIAGAKQKIATTKQGMQYRIKQGVDSDACTKGFWGSENFNVVDNRILAAIGKYNPLIPYAEQAVNAHRNGNEFYLTDKVLLQGKPATQVLKEIAEQDASKPVSKRRVLDLGQAKTHNVPTDSFANDDGIVFLAREKKLAEDYGLFLKNKAGIPQVTFYLPSTQSKDYTRGFWLYRLDDDYRSGFYGCSWVLDIGGGSLFGVRGKASAEGASQKISTGERKTELYSQQELKLAENELEGLSKLLREESTQNLRSLFARLKR